MAVDTPTDRPKSVRNRCVIELFVALFVSSLCPFDISAGIGACVIGLSQISSIFLLIISYFAGCFTESVFDYQMGRKHEVLLTTDKMIIKRKNQYVRNKENNNHVDKGKMYPLTLPKEGILFIFVSKNDAEHPFNLTLLENKAVDKRVIIGIKAYRKQLIMQIQVTYIYLHDECFD